MLETRQQKNGQLHAAPVSQIVAGDFVPALPSVLPLELGIFACMQQCFLGVLLLICPVFTSVYLLIMADLFLSLVLLQVTLKQRRMCILCNNAHSPGMPRDAQFCANVWWF
jgi:hypothetical protein